MRQSTSTPPDSASIPQDGKLEPENDDVAAPKNSRPIRELPEPADELRQWGIKARLKADKRPYPPNVILQAAGFDEEHWTAPHNDLNLWTLQLADAFGTRSRAVISAFMGQLEALCGRNIWDEESHQWRLDECEFSAAIAMINCVKPKNEMEAALAAQMVAVHLMQMKMSEAAIRYGGDSRAASAAGKLARTYVQQIDAMQRLKAPNRAKRQSIKVRKELHQHVHYHDARGGKNFERQPHGPPASQLENCPAMQCPESIAPALPGTSRKGKAGL